MCREDTGPTPGCVACVSDCEVAPAQARPPATPIVAGVRVRCSLLRCVPLPGGSAWLGALSTCAAGTRVLSRIGRLFDRSPLGTFPVALHRISGQRRMPDIQRRVGRAQRLIGGGEGKSCGILATGGARGCRHLRAMRPWCTRTGRDMSQMRTAGGEQVALSDCIQLKREYI